VRELSAGKQFRFQDDGLVHLKGLAEPARVYSVSWLEDA
jgi:hypothetical protein